ncbi:MAG TPA: MaoC family dehydratase [Actinomycetaceae bacterium]|nr:MaoC family dehydratase [Actinomycetaceae bacterium]
MAEATKLAVDVEELPSLQGRTFGPSEWREVTQDDINVFAQVTGDDNPIHVDPEFAKETPYGTTIAHGLLTLSLVVPMMRDVFTVTGAGMGINYGLNRLRFPAPVPVGARLRVSGEVTAVNEIKGGWQLETTVTWEVEGGDKPACVAEMLLRYYR